MVILLSCMMIVVCHAVLQALFEVDRLIARSPRPPLLDLDAEEDEAEEEAFPFFTGGFLALCTHPSPFLPVCSWDAAVHSPNSAFPWFTGGFLGWRCAHPTQPFPFFTSGVRQEAFPSFSLLHEAFFP